LARAFVPRSPLHCVTQREAAQGTIASTPTSVIVSRNENEVVLHFTVADTGIGIPAEKRTEVFESFAQAETSETRSYGGVGLGLPIARRLVSLMGGAIWVESEPGQGSIFHFTASFGAPRGAQSDIASGTKDLGRHVLVVDDSETNRLLVERMLASWQMKPVAVGSGPEALAALEAASARGESFDLVVLDVMMPGMSGFELATRIRQSRSYASTRLVVLASTGQPSDPELLRDLGISSYLTKPVVASELLSAIQEALGVASPAAKAAAEHPWARAIRPLRVLLAEDNLVNQRLALYLLEARGHQVVLAGDGETALSLHDAEPDGFDLLLTDVRMPKLDGYRLTAAVREREKQSGRHLPIVAMTAHAMKGDRERCLEAGMDGYVSKPIEPVELISVVERIASSGAPSLTRSSAPTAVADVDFSQLLARTGGSRELLGQMVEIFREECPRLLAAVREALDRKDCEALEDSAHALKGTVGNFSAGPAAEASRELEIMARGGDLEGTDEIYGRLKQEIERLGAGLEALCSGG
jgi:CheY-like chemotaxis protein